VQLRLSRRTDFPGGVYDKRPCLGEGFVRDKTYAFYFDTASDIQMRDCEVEWGTPAIEDKGGDVKRVNVK
jgi:hypothetical protein